MEYNPHVHTADDLKQSTELIVANLNIIDHLAERAKSYYTGTISRHSIIQWLLQFSTPSLVYGAIGLLNHLNFVDNDKLVALVNRAVSRIPTLHQKGASIAQIGKSFDSSGAVSYAFTKSTGWKESEIASRWIDLATIEPDPHRTCIILIDDNLASGTQLVQFMKELTGKCSDRPEHFPQPVTPERLAHLQTVPIYACVALALGNGATEACEAARALGFDLHVLSGESEQTRWLEYGCTIWPNEEAATGFRTFALGLGSLLFSDKEWPAEQIRERALGYGNLQKLTVFAHNTPKNLVSCLWKYGSSGGHQWIPLFPERGEWTQYQQEIRHGVPALALIASAISNGGLGRRTPLCRVALNKDGEPLENLDVRIGDRSIRAELEKDLVADTGHISTWPLPEPSRGPFSPFTMGRAHVEEYNREVYHYNEVAFPQYCQDARRSIDELLRLCMVPLRIYNQGSATANEVVLELELPPDMDYRSVPPPFPAPPVPPREPPDRVPGLNSSIQVTAVLRDSREFVDSQLQPSDRVRLVKDRGTKIVKIFFGKVLAGTFRDFDLRYLLLPGEGQVHLRYRLAFEEASVPETGSLGLTPSLVGDFSGEVGQIWRGYRQSKQT